VAPETSLVHQPSGAAPVAHNNTWFLDEDTPLTVPAASGVLANDSDPEGNALTAVRNANVSHGALTLNANGSFTYTPAHDYNGLDSFTYHAHDGTSSSNVVTVTFRIRSVNDAPVANSDTFVTAADAVLQVPAPGLLGNDLEPEGDPMHIGRYDRQSVANGAALLGQDGGFTYTPPPGFNGIDTFTYGVGDPVRFMGTAQGEAINASTDVSLGDLDGDGDLDVFVTNYNEPDRVWLNNGDGTFSDSGQSFGGNTISWGVSLGDLDGDGDLDAFVLNNGGSLVWRNDGFGTFTGPGQPLGAIASGLGVRLGDLDGDGDLDAFIATSGGGARVWRNNGSGTFSDSGQILGGNTTSWDVSLGDLDGDGDLDAFIVNDFNEPDTVWRNDGTGMFSNSGQALGSSNGYGVSLGDLDGDGDLDAFVANFNGPNMVWRNNGSGVFTDSGQALGSSNGRGVSLGDLDGDGDLDAFVANDILQPNRVWRNDGSGNFSDSGQDLGNSSSWGVAVGDLDGDGDLDAIVANHAGQPNRVWRNNGSGSFSESGSSLQGSASQGADLGDVDGDGDLDVMIANYGQYSRLWRNDGGGSFSDSGQVLGSSDSKDVRFGDLDGDGDLDAFIANSSNQPNRVWRNNGSGTFSDSGQALGSSQSNGVSLGDLDGDGDLDAFVANAGQPDRIWRNNGYGTFSDSGQALGSSMSYAVSLGDVDGDGDLDAFVAGSGANLVWLNNGTGTFTDSGQALGSSNSYDVGLGDLDADGDLDAFVANNNQANRVWFNNGSGVFSDSGQALGSSQSRGVKLGDLDGDGDLDAFVANYNKQANRVWLNNGNGVFSDSGEALGGANSNDVSLGDLDGDGDLDAFVANSGSQLCRAWLNDNTRSTSATVTMTVGTPNDPPTITSNGGGATATISVPENQTAVTTVMATDPENDPRTYTITGGAEGSRFSINGTSGVLTFVNPPNFENPTDAGANNTYIVTVTATATGGSDAQTITVTITNVNEPPVITSNGGGASATIFVAENETAVTTVTAVNPESGSLTFSITGGVDQAAFSINASSGVLTFVSAPDFQNPTDTDANNTYLVNVTATATSGSDTQMVTVIVTADPVNRPPTVSAGGPYTADEGAGVTLTANGTDLDGDALVYTWDLDNDGSYNDGTGQTVTFNGDDGPRVQAIGVRAQDPSGLSGTAVGSVTIRNVAPTILTVTFLPTTPDESSSVSFTASAVDPANDPLAYVWSWDDGTTDGAGASTTHAFNDDGAYTVTLTVTDEDGDLDAEVQTVTVANASPSFRNATPPTQVPNGAEYTYDADMIEPGTTDVLTWNLTAAPAGMTIDPTATCGQTPTNNPPRCRRLRWTPTPAQRQQTTPFDVVLDVTDGDGGSTRLSWTIEANPIDTDSGGASDSCELAYGLNITDPADDTADPDRDGILTRDECLAGTNPTVSNAPSAPTPYAPVNNALVTSPTVTLVVDNATDPDGDLLRYVFEVVDRDSDTAVYSTSPAALVPSGASRSQTVITEDPDNLMVFEEDGRYLWHAAAFDGHVYGPVSIAGFFIFSLDDGVPTAPVAVSPIGVTSSLSPTLTVDNATDPEGEALTYEFELLDGLTFELVDAELTVPQGAGDMTGWPVTARLADGGTYRWRSRATDGRHNISGTGAWSEWATFEVDTAYVPLPAPALLTPPDGVELPSDATITLTWTNVADPDGGAVTYTLGVRLQANPDTTVFSMEDIVAAEGDDTSVDVGVLDAGVYTWRVSATAGGNPSDWSETWTFLVRTPDTGDGDVVDAGMDSGTDAGTGMDGGTDADGPDAPDLHPDAPADADGPSDAANGISLANTTFGCATTPAAPLSTGDLALALLGLIGLAVARKSVIAKRKEN